MNAVSVTAVLDELRHSIRLLRRSPALTVAAVCTLAIALGASTAVFSVVDKVLVRPLPIDEPDRVMVIWPRERANPTTIGEIAYATFRSWQNETRSFADLAAIGSTNWSLILQEGEPATLPVAGVSGSFFPLLGTQAALGRTLLPEDDAPGAERVAVISHASWTSRFASDTAIVGRALRFRDAVYTVVGVMPAGFDYPRGVELWVPVVPQLADANAKWGADVLGDPRFGVLFVLGRLNPGVAIDAARNELSALITKGAGIAFRPGMEATLTPLDDHIFGTTRPALLALAACVGLVLLIGCANVAVLLLARAATRAHETAVRLAIGAARWRIVRQSLSDALVLAVLGGVAGLGLAYWTVDLLVVLAPSDVPRLDAVRLDARTFVFAWTTWLLTAVLVGLGPGLQASRWDLANVLSHGSPRFARSHRLRRAFVVAQVGLAVVLLACAGLVGRSFINLLRLDVGFNPVNVLTLDVTVPDAPADRHNQFYTALLARAAAMPGVEAAGAVFQRPLEHSGIGMDAAITIEGQRVGLEFRDWEQNPPVNFESVTPEYFRAVGTRLLRGRTFDDRDIERAPRVAIVSDRLARRLWPGQDPIGRRIFAPGVLDPADAALQQLWPTVVGVVADARYRGLSDLRFDLYVPYLQHSGLLVKHLMVRTSRDPLALVDAIQNEAKALESTALVENVATMDQIVGQAMAPWRFSASTLALLGLLALVLASLGVYAIVSQSVVERTREIGIRVAVGALPSQIAGLVLHDGLRLTAMGLALGLAAAIAAGRVLTSLLYEVQPGDPLTLTSMAVLFMIVSTAAILLPVWRATRVDPVCALRE
jgi:putative ABC transport system permease protein